MPVHTPHRHITRSGLSQGAGKYGYSRQPGKSEMRRLHADARGYDIPGYWKEGVTFGALFACNDDTAWARQKRCAGPDYASRRILSRCLVLTRCAGRSTARERGFQQSIYPSRDILATAIDQAVRTANSEPVARSALYRHADSARGSVAAGPVFNVRPNDALRHLQR